MEGDSMLVLSRKVGEKITIGDNITIVVNRISGNRVAIGIDAPHSIRVLRGELEPFATAFDEPNKGKEAEAGKESEAGLASSGPSALAPTVADPTNPTANMPRLAR